VAATTQRRATTPERERRGLQVRLWAKQHTSDHDGTPARFRALPGSPFPAQHGIHGAS
jgi:hypothetical protein